MLVWKLLFGKFGSVNNGGKQLLKFYSLALWHCTPHTNWVRRLKPRCNRLRAFKATLCGKLSSAHFKSDMLRNILHSVVISMSIFHQWYLSSQVCLISISPEFTNHVIPMHNILLKGKQLTWSRLTFFVKLIFDILYVLNDKAFMVEILDARVQTGTIFPLTLHHESWDAVGKITGIFFCHTPIPKQYYWGYNLVSNESTIACQNSRVAPHHCTIYVMNWCVAHWNEHDTMDVIIFFISHRGGLTREKV